MVPEAGWGGDGKEFFRSTGHFPLLGLGAGKRGALSL